MTRPPSHGYDTPTTGVIGGMRKRRKVTAAVTGLVTAGLVLSGCSTVTAGTAAPSAELGTYTAAPSTPKITPKPAPSDPFTARVERTVDDILAWWAPRTGDDYDDVSVVVYTGINDGKCYAKHGYAVVCTYPGGRATVAVDREDVEPVTRESAYGGKMTLALFLAHEVGHIVTERLDPGVTDRMTRETRAECAAAVYMSQQGKTYGTIDELANVALVKRLDAFDDDAAKARQEIHDAFMTGADFTTADQCIAAFPG